MPAVSPGQLAQLQNESERVRNICILAHVDHGKTSLSDSLLASNGIISKRLAGKARYLDSREDEQLRGITMESSAISLYFKVFRKTADRELTGTDYLINLIDSPGHVDFSSEVSTASRLCDGALVLVDVVEGVCSQTVMVLRQTWIEKLQPILVLNKIDRLITELKLTPFEAYQNLNKIIEQVNAIIGSFFAGDRMAEDFRRREAENTSDATYRNTEYIEPDDTTIYFEPKSGNVIFASAIDGWAFRISQFAEFYADLLGMSENSLNKCLWGDYYREPKTSKIIGAKHLRNRNLKPLFVQLILENIWTVYQNIRLDRNQNKIEKIIETLNIKISPRELRSKDSKALLLSVFSQWIPLASAVLTAVCDYIPSAKISQAKRFPDIIANLSTDDSIKKNFNRTICACSSEHDAPVVAYVSKMLSVPKSDLSHGYRQQITFDKARSDGKVHPNTIDRVIDKSIDMTLPSQRVEDNNFPVAETAMAEKTDDGNREQLIGFARVYSGTIEVGQYVYVYGPKYDPSKLEKPPQVQITGLYMIMGRELYPLQRVPAGNVCGVSGLDKHILKSGTLCSFEPAVDLAGVRLEGDPIVNVALEPVHPQDMPKLEQGLRLLDQADPCVKVLTQDTGEHVILTAGELHLERCLKDLRERFANVEIQASRPIVPFRETVTTTCEENKTKLNYENFKSASGDVAIKLMLRPLPCEITDYLTKNAKALKYVMTRRTFSRHSAKDDKHHVSNHAPEDKDNISLISVCFQVEQDLRNIFQTLPGKKVFADIVDRICAFGSKGMGPNILIDNTETCHMPRLFHQSVAEGKIRRSSNVFKDWINGNVITAFQLATQNGPLCNEPVQGVVCSLEEISINTQEQETKASVSLTGQIISTFKEAFKQTFLVSSPRLLLAMYTCDIQASADVLGRVYSVISRRKGQVVAEELREGTPFFTISAKLPVVESFGFADEIRKRTSGEASPQLIFSGFEILNEDPFWVPTTEIELEDLGELAERENLAKRYVDSVRRRKGLYVEDKIVKHAEKQRTMKR